MTRLQRMWARLICNASTHQMDWPHYYASGTGRRRCMRCQAPMVEPPSIVGHLHPDQGE